MAESFSEAPSRQTEEDRREPSLTDTLVSILDRVNRSDSEYLNNASLREEQKMILSRLPEGIVEELQAHLMSVYIEQRRHNPNKFINDFSYLKGEVFERLLQIEDDLYNLFPDSTNDEGDDERKRIGKALLSLMQKPDRFGFDAYSISNPDVVEIRFENGTYIIKTSIEAKTHIDGRTKHQLSDKGFRSALTEAVDRVNQLEDPQAHGLEGLGINGSKIGISDMYEQVLIVPRDQSLEENDIDRSVSTKYALSKEHAKYFSQKLKRMQSRETLLRSRFSQAELNQLTRYFLDRINAKAAQEKEQAIHIQN